MGTQIVSLIIGIILGASLVLAGFTEPSRILRALRLKDIHTIRTVLVIFVIAVAGTFLITIFSKVEIANKPAAMVTLIIGGLLFGAGIGFTGYTPGTSLAGAASGKVDAIFAFLGMFFGAYVFVFIYPPAIEPLENTYNFGPLTLPKITHLPYVIWTIIFLAAGTIGLILTLIIRTRKTVPVINEDKEFEASEEFIEKPIPKSITGENSISEKINSFDSIQVFNFWKNIFFSISVICLLLTQILFWLVNAQSKSIETDMPLGLSLEQISMILNITNITLATASILYVLSIIFCLSISSSENIGGLRYISRAFFSAIIALILLLPWQILFGNLVLGAIFTPSELFGSNLSNSDYSSSPILLYLRFAGYWILVMFLLIRSYIYSRKWIKSLMDRIDQII